MLFLSVSFQLYNFDLPGPSARFCKDPTHGPIPPNRFKSKALSKSKIRTSIEPPNWDFLFLFFGCFGKEYAAPTVDVFFYLLLKFDGCNFLSGNQS